MNARKATVDVPDHKVRLYSVPETAALLSVGQGYVYRLLNTGRLRYVEVGDERTKRRIRSDDLDRFINDRTH